jgi:hypothetical protein
MKVEIVERFSVELCDTSPDKIFVFGDNIVKRGRVGQAVIRNQKNAVGIPTKKYPAMRGGSFFSDDELTHNRAAIDKAVEEVRGLITPWRNTVVFPRDGLGTGLAKLKEKAPMTWEYLCKKLKDEFGFDNGVL